MSKRRNKKTEDSGMDESWLLPYADILTLLLALFIVLYAMSSVDAQKFQELSRAFNSVFVGKQGILEEDEALLPDNQDNVEPMTPKDNDEDDSEEDEELNEEDLGQAERLEVEALTEVQKRVDDYIIKNSLENRFETSLTKQGLLVTIRDHALFDSGSATVREKDKKIAMELSDLLLMDEQREVVIHGHTDNVPIHTAAYESNWELSVMRAINFMKIILVNEDLDPRYFSAKGSGEFQPIATNETKDGRAKNRRVEILIMPLIDLSKDDS